MEYHSSIDARMTTALIQGIDTQKRRDCRKNDLFTLNAHPDEFSVERVFSLDYVRSTFFPGWLRACVSSIRTRHWHAVFTLC
ncbi:MAG: hypothetical protein ACRESJ_31220 [Pseudomonas sp.]|uniref:hypothetical protein n=1 Tax=Pseudomonas sp. TaxID=306 RepID=UPI003D6E9837